MNTGFFAKLHLAVCLPPVPWQQLCGAAWKIPSSIISLQCRQENMEALPQAASQYLPNSFPEGEVPIAPCQNLVFIGKLLKGRMHKNTGERLNSVLP